MARDLEKLEDRLSVGHQSHTLCTGLDTRKFDRWVIWHWTTAGAHKAATFPDEQLAWGVVWLILEYHHRRGMTEATAIDAALTTYRELRSGEDDDRARYADLRASVGPDLDDDSRRAQDYRREMEVMA